MKVVKHFLGIGVVFIVFLFILKSGIVLDFIEQLNLPFFSPVAQLVGAYFGYQIPNSMVLVVEISKTLLFVLLFSLVSSFITPRGKHMEEISFGSRIWINVLSTIIGVLVSGWAANQIMNAFGSADWRGISVSVIIAVVLFLLLGPINKGKTYGKHGKPIGMLSVMAEIAWETILPAAIKIVGCYFVVIFSYMLLNIEGVINQVGAIVLILVGIGIMVGGICMEKMF